MGFGDTGRVNLMKREDKSAQGAIKRAPRESFYPVCGGKGNGAGNNREKG